MAAADQLEWPCDACGMETCPSEQYMITAELWPADRTFLCVGCLESEIGRRLVPADFPEIPLNDTELVDSPRLRSRKGPGRLSEVKYLEAIDWVVDEGWSIDDAAAAWGIDPEFLAIRVRQRSRVGLVRRVFRRVGGVS